MRVLLLSGDLLVVSRVQGAVAAGSAELKVVATSSQALATAAEELPDVLIIDLATATTDLPSIVEQSKAGSKSAPGLSLLDPTCTQSDYRRRVPRAATS